MTAEMIMSWTPEQPLLAALVILLLYALKSVTVVFPISALQVATGHLFETPIALLINLLGLVITVTLPYWIGRLSGAKAIDRVLQKQPKMKQIAERQQKSPIFLSYFLRVIGCLPGDLVSIYLGACRLPFPKFLLGGVMGSGIHMLLYTVMGNAISDPKSPEFLITLILTLLLSAASLIGYRMYEKKANL